MNRSPIPWISLIALWAANATPLAGVIFLGWRVPEVIVLYWFENVVVGYFNIKRMRLAQVPQNPPDKDPNEDIEGFMLHYGMFTFIHGALLAAVLFTGGRDAAVFFGNEEPRWLHLSFFLGVPALVFSHWVSHVVNYIGKEEYKSVSIDNLIFQPYPRLISLHLLLLFGGVVVGALGGPAALVALLVVVKGTLDSVLHVRAHRRRAATHTEVQRHEEEPE